MRNAVIDAACLLIMMAGIAFVLMVAGILSFDNRYEHTYSNGVHCYFAQDGSPIQCIAPQHPMVTTPEALHRQSKKEDEI